MNWDPFEIFKQPAYPGASFVKNENIEIIIKPIIPKQKSQIRATTFDSYCQNCNIIEPYDFKTNEELKLQRK